MEHFHLHITIYICYSNHRQNKYTSYEDIQFHTQICVNPQVVVRGTVQSGKRKSTDLIAFHMNLKFSSLGMHYCRKLDTYILISDKPQYIFNVHQQTYTLSHDHILCHACDYTSQIQSWFGIPGWVDQIIIIGVRVLLVPRPSMDGLLVHRCEDFTALED